MGAVRGGEVGRRWARAVRGESSEWGPPRRAGGIPKKGGAGAVGDTSLGSPRSRVWAQGHLSLAPLFSGTRPTPAGARSWGRPLGACARAVLRSGSECGPRNAGRHGARPSAAPRSHVRLLLAAHLHLLQPFPQGWRDRGVRGLRGHRPECPLQARGSPPFRPVTCRTVDRADRPGRLLGVRRWARTGS